MEDKELLKTKDFVAWCRYRDLNPAEPTSLQLFKNFVIDHGGRLEDCI